MIRNQQVNGSSPFAGSRRNPYNLTELATRLASGESLSCAGSLWRARNNPDVSALYVIWLFVVGAYMWLLMGFELGSEPGDSRSW